MPDIYWKRISDVYPEASWSKTDFIAIDDEREGADERDKYIGVVRQEDHGPQKGTWFWSMTVTLPGPRFPFPTSGRETNRGDAGRRVVECYERMLRFYEDWPRRRAG